MISCNSTCLEKRSKDDIYGWRVWIPSSPFLYLRGGGSEQVNRFRVHFEVGLCADFSRNLYFVE
jgi:hypothetical protein